MIGQELGPVERSLENLCGGCGGAQWARMNAKCAKTGFPHVQCTGSDQLLTCTQASRPGYCVHCISIVRSAREWLKLIKIYENLA